MAWETVEEIVEEGLMLEAKIKRIEKASFAVSAICSDLYEKGYRGDQLWACERAVR